MVIQELINGIKSYFRAAKLITKHNLLHYMFVPGILSLIYIIILIVLGIIYVTDISAYINANLIPDFMRGDIML